MLNKISSKLIIVGVALTLSIISGFFIYTNFIINEESKDEMINDELVNKDDFKEVFNMNLAVKSEYKRKITIPEIGNDETITNRQLFISLDTKSLIDERKLSYDCSNIYFTDSNGEEISFWMGENECYDEESIFWLNIPNTNPYEKKVIYFHYSNESILSGSSFEKVFPKQESEKLIGGYFLGPLIMSKDFSGYGNHGESIEVYMEYADSFYDDWGHYFFNHWGYSRDPNFSVSSLKEADFSHGTIEMWIKPYIIESENYQKIISDSEGNIELGIQPDGDLYFYPALATSKNYNLIKKPFDENEWTHIIVTWNFDKKNSIFYINGVKKTNYIENIPLYWKEKINIGNQWNIGGFAYAGFIDGLRIYSRELTDLEVANAYKFNTQELRHPEVTLGEEELISEEGYAANPLLDLSINEISITDKIVVTSYYANPMEGYYRTSVHDHEGKKAYLVSKNDEDYLGSYIFGYPAHNDSYAGTPITINEPFLLNSVGFKMNDKTLIEKLVVALRSSSCGVCDPSLGEGKDWLHSIVPVAHACGGCGSRTIGESNLTFTREESGVYWYSLDNPILAYGDINMLQIYYLPNRKEGFFSLEISDLIFQSKTGSFARSKIERHKYCNELECPGAYYAYFAPSEKGKIVFSQLEKSKNLLLSFKNTGIDTFTIDNDSFNSIRTLFSRYEKIESINIRSDSGDIIHSFRIEDVMGDVVGITLNPSDSFSVQLPLPDLENNNLYWITVKAQKTSSDAFPVNQKLQKIIHWTMGEDSYYYPSEKLGNDRALYKLDVSANGIFDITYAKRP